ncbi:MAG: hypothetical protein K2H91_10315 [Lachnospiraceae bacterium]|nr:hypothetical protein [Lachnospiraceae bacterium]
MKRSNFKKMLLTLALVIIIQNSVIAAQTLPGNPYAGDESVSPCNDKPIHDEHIN